MTTSKTFTKGEVVEVSIKDPTIGKYIWVRARYTALTTKKMHSVVLQGGRRRAFPNPDIRKIGL